MLRVVAAVTEDFFRCVFYPQWLVFLLCLCLREHFFVFSWFLFSWRSLVGWGTFFVVLVQPQTEAGTVCLDCQG